jgi:hypothetical protein
MSLARSGGGQQIPFGHHVRVDVVVRDRAVLVGARDAVDAKLALEIEVPERTPQASGVHEHFEPDVALELKIAGRVHVPNHCVGNIGVDVEGRRAGGPVPRGLLAVDRTPGKSGALQPEGAGALKRARERRVSPAKRVGGRNRARVREDWQDEHLAVPDPCGSPSSRLPRNPMRPFDNANNDWV